VTLRSRIVDGVFGVLEGAAALYDFVRGIQKRIRRDTDPIPLTRPPAERRSAPVTERIPKPPRVPRDLR
jgi:hypothetical protein